MTRLRPHALTLTWNGERGAESTSTAHCRCGWEESASNQRECRFEYRQHLRRVAEEIGWAAVWGLPNHD